MARVTPFVLLVCVIASDVRSPARGDEGRSQLTVSIDFPGGSATVEEIDQAQRLLRIEPSHHERRGWECWWYLKVSGVTIGETLALDVGSGEWATPDRCCFSIDGRTWSQTASGIRDTEKKRIVYKQRIDAREAWFAWGPPFVPADAEALVRDAVQRCPAAASFELCRTREGRTTPALRVREPGVADEERVGIWLQARQHAWESGSSWVCKGLVDWLVSDDPRAAQLRKKGELVVVPIMDIDNVAVGAGGKDQVPHDHNRDWSDEPHWRGVAEAQQQILKWNAAGRFRLFIDLHNPDAARRRPYFYIPPRELLSVVGNRELDRFLEAAKNEMTGALPFDGHTEQSGSAYDKRWKSISSNWVALHCQENVVAVCLETAWNTPHSVPAGYEEVGRNLGLAIERFLSEAVD